MLSLVSHPRFVMFPMFTTKHQGDGFKITKNFNLKFHKTSLCHFQRIVMIPLSRSFLCWTFCGAVCHVSVLIVLNLGGFIGEGLSGWSVRHTAHTRLTGRRCHHHFIHIRNITNWGHVGDL